MDLLLRLEFGVSPDLLPLARPVPWARVAYLRLPTAGVGRGAALARVSMDNLAQQLGAMCRAEAAETAAGLGPGKGAAPVRLILRRVLPSPGGQLALFTTYHFLKVPLALLAAPDLANSKLMSLSKAGGVVKGPNAPSADVQDGYRRLGGQT